VVAPAPRYGTFLIWAAAGLAVAEAARMVALGAVTRHGARRLGSQWLVAGLFLLGISPALIQPALVPGEADDGVIMAVLRANLNRPGNPLIPALPQSPRLSPFVTESGLELLVPARRCIAAPLPCTPNPAPNLEQRDFGLLGTGFVVRGEWRMQNFPYWWRPDFLPSWLRWRERGRASGS
jgi:hypothetical protein